MSQVLAFALELADLADSITMPRFRAPDLRVETKPDMTPVSEADTAVERALRERIEAARPGETVLGEEEGAGEGDGRRWVIDPIDGTKNYVRGIPVWATLIAFEDEVAVVSAPALGRRWWAARGEGAYADGERIRVSGISQLEDAVVCFTSLHGLGEGYLELAERSWAPRGYGDFWQYMLVAEGAAELAFDPEMNIWDCAAPKLVVEEAGGRFTDLGGEARIDGGSALATNGLLHEAALELLRAR